MKIGSTMIFLLGSGVLFAFARCQFDPKPESARGAPPGSQPVCVRLFCEADYHFNQLIHHTWPRPDENRDMRDNQDMRMGTAFAVVRNGKPVLITAGHVVARRSEESHDFLTHSYPGTIALQETTIRLRVSSLAFVADAVQVDAEHDVAVLEMPEEFWKTIPLRILSVPKVDSILPTAPVMAWGFPSTSVPQFRELAVSDVGEDMIVLNGPLEPGYSGGPVIGVKGDLLGIVLRSTDIQSRCACASEILRLRFN